MKVFRNHLIDVSVIFVLLIITIPLHECVHIVILLAEPWAEPTEYHLFDADGLQYDALGYVEYEIVEEGRPEWFDIFHEVAAYGIQLIVVGFLFIKIRKKYHDAKRTN